MLVFTFFNVNFVQFLFELSSLTLSYWQYLDIWALDEKDPFMQPEGGESVADVVSRLTTALLTIESEFQG